MHQSATFAALKVDEREVKLPQWAQEKINRLRRTTTDAQAELAALKTGTTPGPFFLEHFDSRERFYIPSSQQLMFQPGESEQGRIEISQTYSRPDWLQIRSLASILLVHPEASNSIGVQSQGHKVA